MNREQIHARIEEIGIIPGVRVSNPDSARYAAETLHHAGIPIVEITMTVPDGTHVISDIAKTHPHMIVGAGTVLDKMTALRCLDAGAKFLTSPGLVVEVVEAALEHNVVVFPGALTPSEVIAAWKTGADFVKVFPCASVGGHSYIRSLKVPFPQIPLIASGGVNQHSAANFILAGASALGIGNELIPQEALQHKQQEQIQELSRRFLHIVKTARAQVASTKNSGEDQLH
jgi:2-dehydro-3-deoxyphosphogluconate aldolase / (4S)-4-hydroxy-2-oxoglutarate aldolase